MGQFIENGTEIRDHHDFTKAQRRYEDSLPSVYGASSANISQEEGSFK